MIGFVRGKPSREECVECCLVSVVDMFEIEEAEEVGDVGVVFEVGVGGRCSVLW